MKLEAFIEALGGELLAGSGALEVGGVAAPESAGALDVVFAEKPEQAVVALKSGAGVVVVRASEEDAAGLIAQAGEKALVNARNPRLWFARAAKLLAAEKTAGGSEAARVHASAVLGADVELGAGVVIGAGAALGDQVRVGARTRIEAGAVVGDGCVLGEDCRVHPRAVLYAGVTLGNRVVIHAGAVLGADGFGYVRDGATGAYTQFPQQGTLTLEDDVEVGANSTIDRGALGETRIGRGTKVDNLVHIGHNCRIGEDVIVVALTGISGSCTVGRGAVIAGQVGLGDHATVGEGVILGGQAGVLSGKTLELGEHKPGTVFWGTPAKPLMEHLRELATLAKLAKRAPAVRPTAPSVRETE